MYGKYLKGMNYGLKVFSAYQIAFGHAALHSLLGMGSCYKLKPLDIMKYDPLTRHGAIGSHRVIQSMNVSTMSPEAIYTLNLSSRLAIISQAGDRLRTYRCICDG